MSKTRIEWADAVWNPATGCTKVSPGCKNCYAERFARRLAGRAGYPADEPFRVALHHNRLGQPFEWRKPRRIFVNSMSDLFHPEVPDMFIAAVFGVMAACPQHTFLVLTKRPERMLEWARDAVVPCGACTWHGRPSECNVCHGTGRHPWRERPYTWVWLGVSAENQEYADLRIPLLLQTPAAVRFVSLEPLLGPIDLTNCDGNDVLGPAHDPFWDGLEKLRPAHLDWVIVGSESGPDARPMDEAWVRSIRDQCVTAGVPFFYKQRLDKHGRKVGLPELDGQRWVGIPHDA